MKTIDVEIKALLQSLLGTQKIDAMYFQGYRPTKKEDKDSGKNKFTNTPFGKAHSEK